MQIQAQMLPILLSLISLMAEYGPAQVTFTGCCVQGSWCDPPNSQGGYLEMGDLSFIMKKYLPEVMREEGAQLVSQC